MAYTKQVWKYSGESGAIPLSPANLNHMEDGIYAAALRAVGATTGNICILDANGNPIDSTKKIADFDAAGAAASAVTAHNTSIAAHGGIPTRHAVYKNSLGEEWFKILSFPISERATVKISCYSSHASILQRGHWEMIINRDLDGNIRADLIYSTNVVTSKFSVRSDSGVLKLYFSTPQYTEFTILSEVIIGDATLTTYADTAETPSGTEIPVNYLDILPLLSGKEPYVKALELTGGPGFGGFLDFHFEGATGDYTSRIIEEASGVLRIIAALNLSTALTVANGGTGATTAAGARANLGILSYIGSVTVPSGQNYVNVAITGLTPSHRALAMRTGETQTTTGLIPKSTVCSTNNCRVYFSDDGNPTSVGLHIIATL